MKKVYTDISARLSKGTDASLYRLVPERVDVVTCEEDVRQILAECKKSGKPVTFKGAGTSLSGQAITNAILIEVDPAFGEVEIWEDGRIAKFPCAMTGEEANRRLKPYGRRLGSSMASIKSARIGGIVANNSSGSGQGILCDPYHTVCDMEIILADGTKLDTASIASRKEFFRTHTSLLEGLMNIRMEILMNPEIEERIRAQYELKNTCGYAMNAFLDYASPYDILMHMMIGSEGTLGFISSATFETVSDNPFKATALVYFPDLTGACAAMDSLHQCVVSAAEWMDRNALRAVEDEPGMPETVRMLPEDAVALWIDTSAETEEELLSQCREMEELLTDTQPLYPVSFTTEHRIHAVYGRVRNGWFAIDSGKRPCGTTPIVESIAFRAEVWGIVLKEVRKLLSDHGYDHAAMSGDLWDGTVHLMLFPNMHEREGADQYAKFMQELAEVVLTYDGSLRAEHGTGRHLAPFVKKAWGGEIYKLMWRIKRIFDPSGLLNPGVLMNRDSMVFLKNLKQIPLVNELIDKCIECGLCEAGCPARHATWSPRQRIVIYRRLSTLLTSGKKYSREYRSLRRSFAYKGNATCATDGLCATSCPVGIDTGLWIKELREKEHGFIAHAIARMIAGNMWLVTGALRWLLPIPHKVSQLVGYHTMEQFMAFLFKVSGHRFPLWTRYTPTAASFKQQTGVAHGAEMVYFPTCITRTMGASADYDDVDYVGVTDKTIALLTKAGFTIHYPEKLDRLCCGKTFSDKGFRKQADRKAVELNKALLRASDNGRLPILCDTSPCLLHMRETLDKRLRLYEPVEFIYEFMRDRLRFTRLPVTVAVHATCGTTRMGLKEKLEELANLCAERVVVPPQVSCCGWAGDRGFFYPELTVSGLRYLRPHLEGATEGYSNSRTCEIGLTLNSGISYKAIVYLVDKATS